MVVYLIIAGFAPRTVYLHSPHRIGFDNVFSRLLWFAYELPLLVIKMLYASRTDYLFCLAGYYKYTYIFISRVHADHIISRLSRGPPLYVHCTVYLWSAVGGVEEVKCSLVRGHWSHQHGWVLKHKKKIVKNSFFKILRDYIGECPRSQA